VKVGTIEVNWGSMFSGKTEELFRKVRRSRISGKKIRLYKPKLDKRYSEEEIVTHYGDKFKCTVFDDIEEILKDDLSNIDLVGIDEGQFCGENLVKVCQELKYKGIDVVVSGLDMWSNGDPIMNMALLSAIANKSTKHHAVCVKTGKDAYISHSLVLKEGNVMLGGTDRYIAVCEEVHLNLLEEEKLM
jgi:thymidine kinase